MHVKTPILLVSACVGSLLLARSTAHAKDRKSECIAENEQAQRLRDDLRVTAARELFILCAASSCPAAVRKDCIQQAEALAAQIPTIVPRLVDASGNDVTNARVSVDDKVIASTLDGTPIALDPGAYELKFEVEGKPTITQKVVIASGERNRPVVVSFNSLDGRSVLVVSTTPAGAEVWLDGSYLGKSPVEKSVTEGEHTVRVELAGYDPNTTTLTTKSGDRRSVSLPLRETTRTVLSSPWFWAATGVLVVAAGIGAYVALTTEKSPDTGTLPPGQVTAPLVRF